MDKPRYEYDNFKVDPPRVDDGWYLVKDGITYRVEVPINKMRFTKSVNILTGEVHYPSNADKLRSMTDEELAQFLGVSDACRPSNPKCEHECYLCWLDWLREEASE